MQVIIHQIISRDTPIANISESSTKEYWRRRDALYENRFYQIYR